MIDQLPSPSEDTLVFSATGILSARDYESDFAPRIEQAIAKQGKVNLVLHLDENFEGWDFGAMWDDARFGYKHRHDFKHIAVVGAQAWFKWAMQLGSKVLDGEFRTFEEGQLDEAIAWITGAVVETANARD
ncbi:STAS/SEC14 domain-containing protein [Actomonas aquatica]|uniref:STAS/SEC14 domain-containing protein n=1 Tax=Actomonas aquatica TaxID=2866162 RepID=A0ABZ1CC39_9BACT|nr:STAS/SEC14 domain-containing protein [Opitutus sp. WL0086]WRQ87855.1 STAS/SEC14 domain-containing protein [Opitutus sp. WL0086]